MDRLEGQEAFFEFNHPVLQLSLTRDKSRAFRRNVHLEGGIEFSGQALQGDKIFQDGQRGL